MRLSAEIAKKRTSGRPKNSTNKWRERIQVDDAVALIWGNGIKKVA